uniref:Chemosensory protein 25 n=1 Tax=Matsumurasca onukii TaxID=2912585 RepID=A0A343WH01_MATON|nr:chemosensory protein 25 [Matsumurasca onukii]
MHLRLSILLVTLALMAASTKAAERMSQVSDEALDMALHDKRYLTRQLKCATGEGPCDPVGRRLKTLAPLVLRGACPKCTEAETKQIQKVLSHVQRNYPKEWSKLINQFTTGS